MHYEVQFKGTPAEMEAQAVLEVKDRLGERGVKSLQMARKSLVNSNEPPDARRRMAMFFCRMNGISGYGLAVAVENFMVGEHDVF